MTVTVFEYLILFSIDFYDFISLSVFSIVLASIEKICGTLKTIFDHLEVRRKYFAARRVFHSRLGVWKCGQTRSFVYITYIQSPVFERLLTLDICFKIVN